MKIRMITRYAGPLGSWGPGEVADVPSAEAEGLLAAGAAVAVRAGEAPVETAQAPAGAGPAETAESPAAQPEAKPRRRGRRGRRPKQ